jgi:hypothetical protein
LLELLLTMSACSVAITLSAGLIHRAMHAQSKSRAFADVERSAMRLSNALRRDAHAADEAVTDAESLDEGAVLRLQLAGDEAIEYRREQGTVERVELAGEVIQSREAFRFPADILLSIEQEPPRIVVLTLTTPPVAHSVSAADQRPLPAYATPVALRVAAVLGRSQAMPNSPPEQEQSP